MQKILLISVFFFTTSLVFASKRDTLWNQTDKQGHKQGFWRVNYENGKIKYTGFFKDNKPLGELKRYYDDGTIKAIQYFESNNKSRVKMYYQNGVLAGEGNFIGLMKDSIWKYYSFYDKGLKLMENYTNGVKEGNSVKYYANGKIAEEISWHNNQKHGPWKQYYEDGSIKLSANYMNDIRYGTFISYYPSGKTEVKGNFENDNMQGEWSYYDENGNIKTKINYINGVPQNVKELQEKENEYFKVIDENKGKFPEPDENNIVPN